MALVVSTGELHFLNEAGEVAYIETWRSALARYRDNCKANQTPEINLIGRHVPSQLAPTNMVHTTARLVLHR